MGVYTDRFTLSRIVLTCVYTSVTFKDESLVADKFNTKPV